jgi:transglutaminase-like putative cysteine protease
MHQRTDNFGNRLTFFTIQEPHRELVVDARSEVAVDESYRPWRQTEVSWDQAVACLAEDKSPEALDAYQFVFESPRVRPSQAFAEYAGKSFRPGRGFPEALLDLTGRIYHEFRFDTSATTVRTAPEDVLRKRRGVCQDFAHLQIACLRALHIPARYVSGYLRTQPSPGKPRLIGADVSHAWVSTFCPGIGWLDVDPTNNLIPSDGHVTLAWGRDYGDISPLRGIILGGRNHTLQVNVDLQPLE